MKLCSYNRILKILFVVILLNVFLFPLTVLADPVNTWIGCEIYISALDKTQNLFLLNMQTDRTPISASQMAKDSERVTGIKKIIYSSYKKYIVKNTRNYDVYEKYTEEFNNLVPQSNFTIARSVIESRLTEKYGKNWSFILVEIRTKGSSFPVLYEIRILQGHNKFSGSGSQELVNDIGYATPEGLDSAIISTLEELFPRVEKIIKFEASKPYMFQ